MSATNHCRACGTSIEAASLFCSQCGAPQGQGGTRLAHKGDGIPRDFANSVRICLQKYATFQGRAPRAEFWFFTLFVIIVGFTLGTVIGNLRANVHANFQVVLVIFYLGIILPSISVSVRRLHDLGKSGWWCCLSLIPVIGWIILLVWFCNSGTEGDNRFGPENGQIEPQYRNQWS